MELANIQEVLIEKEKTIRELKDQNEIAGRMIYQEPYYFLLGEDEGKDGSFCQKCYDGENKLIRLQSPNKNGWWECNESDAKVRIKIVVTMTLGMVLSTRAVVERI